MRLIDANQLKEDILIDKTNDPDVINYYINMLDGMETQQTDVWIPVSEGLPQINEETLKRVNATVSIPNTGYRRVYPLIYQYKDGSPKCLHMNKVECKYEVIAWMPLPESYKGV